MFFCRIQCNYFQFKTDSAFSDLNDVQAERGIRDRVETQLKGSDAYMIIIEDKQTHPILNYRVKIGKM